MLIAFCLFKYFPYRGLQRDFLKIAKEAQRRGHLIRVYVQSWEGPKPSGFDIVQVETKSLTNHGQGEEYVSFVHKHLNSHPVDVVVGFNKMPGLDVYYAADVCYEEKVKRQKKGIIGWLYRLTKRYKHFSKYEHETFGSGGCPRLLMLSAVEMKYFQENYGTAQERFFLLPPGIEKDRKYSALSDSLRQKVRIAHNIKSDQFVILQLGSDFKLKGVDRSLKAIASLPENIKNRVVFWIVGNDRPDFYKRLATTLNLKTSQVQFLGARDDIPAILAASDLLLHPSYSESAGMAILEALVAGLPVITSGVCGYAHYVEKAKSGLVLKEPFSQEDMNKGLEYLLSNERYRLECVKNAKHFADIEDLYSMVDYAVDLIEAAKN